MSCRGWGDLMAQFLKLFLVVFSVGFLAACSSGKPQEIQSRVPADKQAPAAIRQSFSAVTSPVADVCERANCITIQKARLGKLFLLISSGKTSGPTPQWLDVKPQVVSFERSKSQLALMEENYATVYQEIKLKNLLKAFDIVSEDAESLTFNWGKGLDSLVMDNVFDIDIPRGIYNDEEEPENDEEAARKVIPVLDSFVRSVEFDALNMHINQVSKVRQIVRKGSAEKPDLQTREQTVDLDLQIRAYLPNADFKTKEADPERRVGFFVSKLKKPAMSTVDRNIISKWDLDPRKGPVTILISGAFPEDYVQAATEAALYWNKVIGQDVIVVKTGVDPQLAPQDRTIMVRWIPWLDAGAAYAQAQADPMTGEILRGQVFMPSAFTRISSGLLLNLNGDKPVNFANSPVMNRATVCDFSRQVNSLVLLAREASDSQRLRLAQDSVRSTVAHEIGHALGLRHNFAGSFSAKFSAAEVAASAKTYLQNPRHPGLETTTTMMDYVSGVDDILSSARIKFAPLSYDQMAMKWAYAEGSEAISEKTSLYCTDEDIDVFAGKSIQVYGCERFDAGPNPLQRKVIDALNTKNTFAKTFFAAIVNKVFPGDQPETTADLKTSLKELAPSGILTLKMLPSLGAILKDSKKEDKIQNRQISIANAKKHLGKDPAEMDEEADAKILKDLKEAGGYAGILKDLLLTTGGEADSHWFSSQFEELSQQPYFKKGRTLGGRDYEFSEADLALIAGFYKTLAPLNAKVLLKSAAVLIPNDAEKEKNILKDSVVQDGEENLLAQIAGHWITRAEESVQFQVGESLSQSVEVPKRFLAKEEREQFLGLISVERLNIGAERSQAALARAELKAQIDQVLLAADASAPVRDANPEIYKKILQSLQEKVRLDKAAVEWLSAEIAMLSQI